MDVDGTISDDSNRVDLVDKDPPDIERYNAYAPFDPARPWCVEMLKIYSDAGFKIIFVTGRPESMRAVTETWIRNRLPFLSDFLIYLRGEHDPEDVVEYKRHRYLADILPVYDVEFALEDRLALAAMWRSEGVPCLLCEDRQ